MDFAELMARFGTALGAGLLMGLQRQHAKFVEDDDAFAGTRTFGLIALSGALATHMATQLESPLVFATILAVVGLWIGVGYRATIGRGDIGLTTELAGLTAFLAGAIAGLGELTVAAALAVAVTTILALKPYTRRLAESIYQEDLAATLQFAVLVALVLPLLPTDPLGPPPFDAASPFNIGLMIVFISGLSFLGYVLIKVVGARRGIPATGLLGGMVSSTALTLTMAERSKTAQQLTNALAVAVLLGWTVMYGRVLIEVAVVNDALMPSVLAPVLAAGLTIAGWAAWTYRRQQTSERGTSDTEFANPFRLKPAIQFGLLYGVILIGSKAASMYLGSAGVLTGAIISGVADVDAITLSMAELSRDGGAISHETATQAIVLAAATNTVVKGALVWFLGSRELGRLVAPAVIAAVVASLALAYAF